MPYVHLTRSKYLYGFHQQHSALKLHGDVGTSPRYRGAGWQWGGQAHDHGPALRAPRQVGSHCRLFVIPCFACRIEGVNFIVAKSSSSLAETALVLYLSMMLCQCGCFLTISNSRVLQSCVCLYPNGDMPPHRFDNHLLSTRVCLHDRFGFKFPELALHRLG